MKHDELLAQVNAVGPFLQDTMARVANTVRNRSMAFLEGAVAAIPPGPVHASIETLRAPSEQDVLRGITAGLSAPA